MKSNQLPSIDATIFFLHLNKLYNAWEVNYIKEFGSLLVVNPKEDGANIKSMAVIGWLLGFSLNETTLLFTPKELVIFASEKKITMLSTLKDHPAASTRPIILLKREKIANDNTDSYEKMFKLIKEHGNSKVGALIKDKKAENQTQGLEVYLREKSIDIVDATQLINDCFTIKEKNELDNMKRASRITTYFLQKLIDEVKKVIDQDLTVPHSKICKKIEDMFDSESTEMRRIQSKLAKYEIKKEFVDIGSSAIVQSGGTYHLKLLSNPNNDNLKPDCIIAGFCCQYKLYNSCVYRTLLINPTNQQQKNYEKVLGLNKVLINNVKVGTKLSALYKLGVEYLNSQLPDLQVPSNFGYGIGLQYKENYLVITDKSDRAFEAGMTFLLICGFKDIKDSKLGDKRYALVLTDVVAVTKEGAEVLTNDAQKKLEDINFAIEIQEEKDKKKQKKQQPSNNLPDRRRRQNRVQKDGVKLQTLQQRNSHQKYLKDQKLQQLKNRLDENFSTDNKKVKEIPYEKVECYKNTSQIPKDLQPGRIYVDNKANAILFPINGVHVAFHINVLKSVVKIDENKLTALRFNFNMPIGGVVGNIRVPAIKQNTLYVKELIYRMENSKGQPQVFRQVKEMQKKIKTAADEQKNKEDIVDQAKLIINKNKKPLLQDLQARPYHIKKVKGTLQCHTNGFRYTPNANKGETIDIIFSNIKNAFFQPCEKQIFAAIHFRLHEPIMIGKKKTEDVQLYSEVGALIDDIQRRGRNQEDSDEEQKQRAARRKLDKQFEAFIKSCNEAIPSQDRFEFQLPRREYGFDGVPFKVKSLLQPTKTCLMNVTDVPFFVMQLNEVEVACFQRMHSNIRNFDLTFIYKDFEKFNRVLSIPIQQVEKIKDWLDRSNIIFYDLQINVKWSKFMQNIRSNFKDFVEDGGWSAWDSDQEQKLQQDEEQGDSEFQAQDDSESESISEQSEQYDDDEDSGSYEDDDDLSEPGLSESQLSRHMDDMDRKKIKKEFESKKNEDQNKKKKR